MQGSNGSMMILSTNSSDSISGTWSSGMTVELNRVMSHAAIPPIISISNFTLTMNDHQNVRILALTDEESKLSDQKQGLIMSRRANTICGMTDIYKYSYKYTANTKWFAGEVVDLAEYQVKNGTRVYQSHALAGLIGGGGKVFDAITCGIQPRNY